MYHYAHSMEVVICVCTHTSEMETEEDFSHSPAMKDGSGTPTKWRRGHGGGTLETDCRRHSELKCKMEAEN